MVSRNAGIPPKTRVASLAERRDIALAAIGAKVVRERVEKRTQFSKIFDLDNGMQHLSQRMVPVHYMGKNGKWADIDTTFKPSNAVGAGPVGAQTTNYVVDAAPHTVEAFGATVGWRHTTEDGEWAQLDLLAVDGKAPDYSKMKVSASGDRVFWDSVAEGIDIFLYCGPDRSEAYKVAQRAFELTWQLTKSSGFDKDNALNEEIQGYDSGQPKCRLELFSSLDAQTGIFTERWTGRVARVVDKATRQRDWFNDPVLPVLVDSSITKKITVGNDDGYEWENNSSWQGTRNYSYVGNFGTPKNNGGFRFLSIALANTDTINSATFTFNVTSVYNTPTSKMYGDKVSSAAAWSNSSRPSQVTKTTASTTISPTGTGVQGFTITAIIAEIVGQAGWSSGNNLRLADLATTAPGSFSYFWFECLEHPGTSEPQLDVTYTAAATGLGFPFQPAANLYNQLLARTM